MEIVIWDVANMKIPVGFMMVSKDWIFNPWREVFRRLKDGREFDKQFVYDFIEEHNRFDIGLEENLDEIAKVSER